MPKKFQVKNALPDTHIDSLTAMEWNQVRPASRRVSHAGLMLFCLFMLVSCGGRQKTPVSAPALTAWMGTVDDIRRFPQDLNVYAAIAGFDKELISRAVQADLDARFNQIFFSAWDMRNASMHRNDVAVIFRTARGYRQAGVPWLQAEWDSLKRNAHLRNFPSRREHAITLRKTDLREMPTHEPRFSKATFDPGTDPFDHFQYSELPPGTPLLITHTTLDGHWHFVECPVAGGWVDADDVAFVDDRFKLLYRNGAYTALVRDNVRLPGSLANIGTVLPLSGKNAGGGLRVLFPVKGSEGAARISEVSLVRGEAVVKPLPLTAGNAANVGNVMMGQRYGWGGMFGARDCSALTREIFTPFGIWLPRNSGAQARTGLVISLKELSLPEKEAAVLAHGVPFLSLVGLRGHVALYVGEYKGRPAIFHNIWGVRVVDGKNDNSRLVIGRAVVTSITPGMELKNLYRTTTFGDRLRTLSTPADARF